MLEHRTRKSKSDIVNCNGQNTVLHYIMLSQLLGRPSGLFLQVIRRKFYLYTLYRPQEVHVSLMSPSSIGYALIRREYDPESAGVSECIIPSDILLKTLISIINIFIQNSRPLTSSRTCYLRYERHMLYL
jgi:hypothetical protein